MNAEKGPFLKIHEDKVLFREALNYTAAVTGFPERLIEKDYYCSLLLERLSNAGESLVFKGGTCLAKVYADFYRLSEDLDFSVSISAHATRKQRSTQAEPFKIVIADLPAAVPCFRMVQSVQGANSSTQYIAAAAYSSLVSGQEETIKIEVGLREPLIEPPVMKLAEAVLLDPVSGMRMARAVSIACIGQTEAYAEKFRAALTRREPAIRDFFDLDYAVRNLGVHPLSPDMLKMIAQKVLMPGNDPVDVSDFRRKVLEQQTASQLKAMLRRQDFTEFDLERVFTMVKQVAEQLKTGD